MNKKNMYWAHLKNFAHTKEIKDIAAAISSTPPFASTPEASAQPTTPAPQNNFVISELRDRLGRALTLPLEILFDSPLQTRQLDKKRVEELMAHLLQNQLTTPIIVRPHADKAHCFEIIAGHHRVAAFRALGRAEIPAIVTQLDDVEAEKRIFFDNLMAPHIPDYEKYKGFAMLRNRTGQSHESLAKNAGISKTLVTFYFAYEKLPLTARALLDDYPDLIGANTAQKLVAAKVPEPLVLEVLKKIQRGELYQSGILAFLSQSNANGPNRIFSLKETINKNEKSHCTLSTRNNRTTLTFPNSEEARLWHEKIRVFIEQELGKKESPP
ncbi:MAG: ParB/RepB/Spo0J family partition protein [Ottowia sp.]|nr:ParB/RepB/Spo0J family partition protein [Ottowia sp.]